MKKCSHCNQIKPFKEFNKCSAQKDGFNYYCRECSRASVRKWGRSGKGITNYRKHSLKRLYNITPHEWDSLFEKQLGACAICGKVNKRLVTDHDHKTGKVRGLLCDFCNTMLKAVENKLFNRLASLYLHGNKIEVFK